MSTLFKELLQMATYRPRLEVKTEMALVPPRNAVPLNPGHTFLSVISTSFTNCLKCAAKLKCAVCSFTCGAYTVILTLAKRWQPYLPFRHRERRQGRARQAQWLINIGTHLSSLFVFHLRWCRPVVCLHLPQKCVLLPFVWLHFSTFSMLDYKSVCLS